MPGKLTLDNRPRQICITGFDLEEKEDLSKHFSVSRKKHDYMVMYISICIYPYMDIV